jgi:alpha-ketoglutarate-dependent taurine dioxygenase
MQSHASAAALDLSFNADSWLPILRVSTGDATSWLAERRTELRKAVREHGALLIRGLGLDSADAVAAAFRVLADELMPQYEAFATRWTYEEGVYSSSNWPPDQPMCMHHELSYAMQVPTLLLFACLTAPQSGGITGLADARAIAAALPAELVERFEREGWLLTRSYNGEIGVSWTEAFGTSDRAEVERYCRANEIDSDWLPDGSLRTRQRRRTLIPHPVSGERCWFNQVAFLNEWTMAPEVREYLVDVYGREGLPFNSAYGSGEPIGADVIQLLNDVYEANTVREPWLRGDLMIVDNIRTAHSREAYEGTREVLVAMGDSMPVTDVAG